MQACGRLRTGLLTVRHCLHLHPTHIFYGAIGLMTLSSLTPGTNYIDRWKTPPEGSVAPPASSLKVAP
jgi:hypothetical protein